MFGKKFFTIVCAVLLAITCVGFVACGSGGDDEDNKKHSTTARNGLQKKNCRQKDLRG